MVGEDLDPGASTSVPFFGHLSPGPLASLPASFTGSYS